MRAGVAESGKGRTGRLDLAEARYALPPLHVDLSTLLPPHLITVPSPDSSTPHAIAEAESSAISSNLADTSVAALASNLARALDSRSGGPDEAAVAEHAAYSQAATLSAHEWRTLLADPALSAHLDAAALAELLHRTQSQAFASVLLARADYSGTKTSKQAASAQDTLPRALRLSPTPLPHATGMRLANVLFDLGGLDVCWRAAAAEDAEAAGDAAEAFRETITALDLRARAGEAGMELEVCLAEAFFSTQAYSHQ
jgi:hypothetical protein